MGKPRKGICPYCGKYRNLTTDHVIATCLFIDSLPPNLITIKACHECNTKKKSGDDSFLRDFLCVDLQGSTHPMAQKLFEGKVMRSVGQNKSELGTLIRANASPKPFYSPHGVYVGNAIQCEIPDRRIERIMSTIVRGLYFDARKKRLPDNCQFRITRHFFEWEIKAVRQIMGRLHMHGPRFLGHVFGYDYAIPADDPYYTMWVLWFYRRVLYTVLTEATELQSPMIDS